MKIVAFKRIFILLLLVSIITPFSFAEESQAVKICKENFDKKIGQLNTQKDKLSELINYSSEKQAVVQKAIDSLGKYRKKIIFLTKTNLIKSLLKLGFNTYQEISPLGGTSGKLIEIFAWFEGKAQDYVLDTTLGTKDYYSKHITFLSDAAKNLTPEVELLTKMQEAGLEAFKAKMYREQKKEIGDIGAVYAKLRNLSEQSLKAQTSLKQMNQRLLELIKNQSIELGQIDEKIQSYTDSKNITCKDYDKPVEEDNVSDIAVTISYSPDSPQCVSIEDAQATANSLCAAYKTAKEAENDFLQQFNDKFKIFSDNLFDEQKSALEKTYKDYKLTKLFDMDIDECNLNPPYYYDCYSDYPDISKCTLSNIIDISKEQATNNYTLYNNYYKLLSSHKDDFHQFVEDFLNSDIGKKLKNSELAIDSLRNKIDNCNSHQYFADKPCDEFYSEGNSRYRNVINSIYNTASSAQSSYFEKINDAKSSSLSEKDFLDTRLNNMIQIAKNCVKQDADYLPVVEDKLKNWENHIDEYIMAKTNLLNFLANLKEKKMITYTSEQTWNGTYFTYNINYQYFKDMYDNFKGTDIEFLKMVQDTLRPIMVDLANLNSFFLSAKDLVYPDGDIGSYILSSSLPIFNVDGVMSMKKRYITLKENLKSITADTYDVLNVLSFGNNIISGSSNFNNVINLRNSIYSELEKHLTFLNHWTNGSIIINGKKELEAFKKEIYTAESFKYNVQSVSINFDGISSDLNKSIENAKSSIFQKATQILPPEESSSFDLNKTVSPCKSQILDFNLSKKLVVITGDNKATLDIKMDSCDGRGLSLIADVNDSDAIMLEPSWDQGFDKIFPPDFTQNFYKNNSAKLTLSSKNDLDGTYNLTIKLLDNYDSIMTKTIPVKVVSSTTKKEIKKGWTLVSGNFDAANLSNDISIIWRYKDGYWYANSPYQDIKDLIKKAVIRSNIRSLTNSQNNDGIWVHAKNDTDIDMFDISEHANDTKYQNGWTLGGVYEDTYIKDITCENNNSLPLIWKYSDGNWTNYSAIYSTIKDTDMLNTNDGFWILCK